MDKLRIVLAHGSLADYPEAGGHWTGYLQYLLGLSDLGHDVTWLELMNQSTNPDRDDYCIRSFFDRMSSYGFGDRCVLLVFPRGAKSRSLEVAEPFGKSTAATREIAGSADLLWNFACAVQQPLLSLFKRRVLVDGDPGHLHVSALEWDLGFREHHVFLTAGTNLRAHDCQVPTLGYTWHPFVQFVYLPMWPCAPDPGPQAPFTSITQWTWEELWWGERVLSVSKRAAYLRHVDIPLRTGRPFSLAANIDPHDDTGDRGLLTASGWGLVDPHVVAGSPSLYADYIRRSRAEFLCPKPVYRELRTGWFSERSACFLASGRPVLAEDTGLAPTLPTGRGLVIFRDADEAVTLVKEIDGNYAAHHQAARELAEEYLGSRRCLAAMLEKCL